jgi:hypothetical protein
MHEKNEGIIPSEIRPERIKPIIKEFPEHVSSNSKPYLAWQEGILIRKSDEGRIEDDTSFMPAGLPLELFPSFKEAATSHTPVVYRKSDVSDRDRPVDRVREIPEKVRRSRADLEVIAEHLATADIEEDKRLGRFPKGKANEVRFLTFTDRRMAVFKPADGEKDTHRDHVKAGDYYKRERATYLVDRAIGFDFVPPTVIREIDGRIGSVQDFIEDGRGRYVDNPELDSLGIFDYFVWHTDRHDGNLMFEDEHVKAPDNSHTFGEDDLRLYQDIRGQHIEADVIERINGFNGDDERQAALRAELVDEDLLPEAEIDACLARIRYGGKILATKGRFDRDDVLHYFPQS